MPPKQYGLDCIGIEIETVGTHHAEVSNIINSRYWRTDHDASIETDARILGNGLVITSSPSKVSLNSAQVVLGTEIILNPPINLESTGQLLPILQEVTDDLMSLGEPEESIRAGIHVHVSSPMSLRILKGYVQLGAHLEDAFFYLGGQGYKFRGMLMNNNAYCRPITKFGPPVVGCGGRFAQVFDTTDLLDTQTTEEFWARYGNINPNREVPRYHPARYTWLNLYSLLYHGSLEFRVFNTTLNPYFIYSEVLFCKAFVELCLSLAFSKEPTLHLLEENSVYDGRDKSAILQTLSEATSRMNLDGKIINILGDIIARTPPVTFDKQYMFTHLRNTGDYSFSSRRGIHYLDRDEFILPNVVDIHSLRGER